MHAHAQSTEAATKTQAENPRKDINSMKHDHGKHITRLKEQSEHPITAGTATEIDAPSALHGQYTRSGQ